MRGGRVTESDTYVGGRWRAGRDRVTDLGMVPAREAADLLLALAPQAGDDDGGELVTAATLADSAVVWPAAAPHGAGHEGPRGDPAPGGLLAGPGGGRGGDAKGLDSIATDGGGEIEMRKQAVFALSQRPADEGVPVADPDRADATRIPSCARSALFWLGQSEDPRALTLFEEILR